MKKHSIASPGDCQTLFPEAGSDAGRREKRTESINCNKNFLRDTEVSFTRNALDELE
jgi:hypothetical protein